MPADICRSFELCYVDRLQYTWICSGQADITGHFLKYNFEVFILESAIIKFDLLFWFIIIYIRLYTFGLSDLFYNANVL